MSRVHTYILRHTNPHNPMSLWLVFIVACMFGVAHGVDPVLLETHEHFYRFLGYTNSTKKTFVMFHTGDGDWYPNNFKIDSEPAVQVFLKFFGPQKLPSIGAMSSKGFEFVKASETQRDFLEKWVDIRSSAIAQLDMRTIDGFGNDELAVILHMHDCPTEPHPEPYVTACIDEPTLFECSPVLFGKYIDATCDVNRSFVPSLMGVESIAEKSIRPYFNKVEVYISSVLPSVAAHSSPPTACATDDEECSHIVFWGNYSSNFALKMNIREPTLVVYKRNKTRLAQVGKLTDARASLVVLDPDRVDLAVKHGNFSGAIDPEWTPELQEAMSKKPKSTIAQEKQSILGKLFSFRI